MQSALSLGEIEHSLQQADPQTRHQMLRAVTDMFLSRPAGFDDDRVDVFDTMFDSLLGNSDVEDLVDASQRMASVDNAPPRLIRRLAADDRIAVAGPVLAQSPQLSADDLHEIALTKGNDHLLAISERPGLSEPVTDALIQRGSRAVARKVAENTTARLSRAGLERLVTLAERDGVLSKGLGTRHDIPPDRMRALIAAAAARAEQRLQAVAAAQRLALLKKQTKKLVDATFLDFARNNRLEEVIAGLALGVDLQYDAIENLMMASEPGGILLVCKALDLRWQTVSSVLTLAEENGGPSHDLARADAEYAGLTKPTAERIIRFWRVRQTIS